MVTISFFYSSQAPNHRNQHKPPPTESRPIELLTEDVTPAHGQDGIGSDGESQVHVLFIFYLTAN